MKQFTMKIDDGLLLAAKQHALRSGRNVSEIVRELLAREVGWSEAPEHVRLDPAVARPVLADYSAGRLSRRQAMEALDLAPDQQPEFVDAMNDLGLAWPEPDWQQIEDEAEVLAEAIRED